MKFTLKMLEKSKKLLNNKKSCNPLVTETIDRRTDNGGHGECMIASSDTVDFSDELKDDLDEKTSFDLSDELKDDILEKVSLKKALENVRRLFYANSGIKQKQTWRVYHPSSKNQKQKRSRQKHLLNICCVTASKPIT